MLLETDTEWLLLRSKNDTTCAHLAAASVDRPTSATRSTCSCTTFRRSRRVALHSSRKPNTTPSLGKALLWQTFEAASLRERRSKFAAPWHGSAQTNRAKSGWLVVLSAMSRWSLRKVLELVGPACLISVAYVRTSTRRNASAEMPTHIHTVSRTQHREAALHMYRPMAFCRRATLTQPGQRYLPFVLRDCDLRRRLFHNQTT